MIPISYDDDKVRDMFQFISRGNNFLSNYELGTDNLIKHQEFYQASLSIMRGKVPQMSESIKNFESRSIIANEVVTKLPIIANNTKQNQLADVASNLPRNRQLQLQLLGTLKNVEQVMTAEESQEPLGAQIKNNNIASPFDSPLNARKKNKSKSNINTTLVGAIEHLPTARQIQLLGVLRNLENRIKLSTAEYAHDGNRSSVQPPPPAAAAAAGLNIQSSSPPPQPPVVQVVPPSISEVAARYDTKRITNAQVSQALRRLGKAMMSKTFKTLRYNFNSRESKDIVSVTSIRERVLQLLNIRLSDKDIVILMSRFDRESNGQVDLVDILGNAKLYYARILQEQKIQDDTNQLKMKYEEFARKQRVARMEEKTVINNILSSKIRELEGTGDGGESEIQNFSYLNLIKES